MKLISRLLLLAGAAGMGLAALLPWVTIGGVTLDLGLISAQVAPGAKTVSGTDTSIWPVLIGVAALVALLAILNVARKLLLALGLLVIAAGVGLQYYVSNAVEIETDGSGVIQETLANALVTNSAGPGPPVLIASGVAIVVGALLS